MPAKFNLYSAWMDPYLYSVAAVFFAALFLMIYSMRRYLELKNAADADFDGTADAGAEGALALADAGEGETAEPPAEAKEEKTLVFMAEQPELTAAQPEPEPAPEPQAQPMPDCECAPVDAPAPAEAAHGPSPAENFVHGIYSGIADLDERMKGIEAALSKTHINNDFTVKFLEDIVQDIDTLDKVKIKARLEYLLSDLKK